MRATESQFLRRFHDSFPDAILSYNVKSAANELNKFKVFDRSKSLIPRSILLHLSLKTSRRYIEEG